MSNEKNKRKRTAAPLPNDTASLSINDLPNLLFAHISIYLAKPSRALLALAMSDTVCRTPTDEERQHQANYVQRFESNMIPNQLHSQVIEFLPSLVSRVILSSTNWSTLDFGDIEKNLSEKLRDVYILWILHHINAKEVIKTLKLTGCINICGSRLEPLLESTTLQQIDLSLVGRHEDPDIDPGRDPSIEEEFVLPILTSIISQPNTSMKHITIPMSWRYEVKPIMRQFLDQYHELLESQRLCCSQCNEIIHHTPGGDSKWYDDREDDKFFGTQNHTCSSCLKYFCDEHSWNPSQLDGTHDRLFHCDFCQRSTCNQCTDLGEFCEICDSNICKKCGVHSRCSECDKKVCSICILTCGGCDKEYCVGSRYNVGCTRICIGEDCDNYHCNSCFDQQEYDVRRCSACHKELCNCCRCERARKGTLNCSMCAYYT